MNIFKQTDELTTTDKEIIYQIYDWFVPETDKIQYDNTQDAREYTVNIYGKTNDGISICSKVIGFEPYFYIKPPKEWEELSDKEFENNVKLLKLKLKTEYYDYKFKGKITKKKIISKYYEEHLTNIEIEYKKDFWDLQIIKNLDLLKLVLNH